MIYSHNADTDGDPPAALELRDLIAKIVNHAVNLFYHRLRKYFHFHTDLYRCNRPPRHYEPTLNNCSLTGNNFAKRAVAPPRLYSPSTILQIDHAVLSFDRRNQLRRPINCNKVFIEMYSDEIPLVRGSVSVNSPFKQPPKLCQQTKFYLGKGI